jgi:predicted lipoprotein with Yx(FWY)xxD motif
MAPPTTTTTVAATQNLSITPAVIKSLLQAGAAYHSLPSKDFTGLAPGMTYYAFDPANNTFYAAAGLDASPNSLQAQIGDQDDGGYNIFVRVATATNWTVYNDGLGAAQDVKCPITFPGSVLAVWNWKAGSCFPPQ